MSFWATGVILNLISIIPFISSNIINTLLGSSSLSDYGLRRFSTIHFLLGLFSVLLLVIHILILHRTEPSSSGHLTNDGFSQIILFYLKLLILCFF